MAGRGRDSDYRYFRGCAKGYASGALSPSRTAHPHPTALPLALGKGARVRCHVFRAPGAERSERFGEAAAERGSHREESGLLTRHAAIPILQLLWQLL
jgi:hypothetical protein